MEYEGLLLHINTSQLAYTIIAWEPSVVQVTHSYSRRLPELGHELRFQLFFPKKSRPIQLRLLSLKHSRGSPDFINQNFSSNRTNKQTHSQTAKHIPNYICYRYQITFAIYTNLHVLSVPSYMSYLYQIKCGICTKLNVLSVPN